MKRSLVLVGALACAACAGPERRDPRLDPDRLEQAWSQAIDQRTKALAEQIEREYAPKSTFNLSNSLRQSFVSLEARVNQIEQEQRAVEPRELTELLAPLRTALADTVTRVDGLEADMNATLDDLFAMREEVRGVLATLEAYRDANRATLEAQREVLSRQLRALDEVLSPKAAQRGDG